MYIQWGNYRHGIAETDLSIVPQDTLNALGQPAAVEWIWRMKGRLKNPTGVSSAFKAILKEFVDAYSQNGKDLILKLSNGRNSYHELLSRNCIGGTRVTVRPSFPTGKQGEYIHYRSYDIEVRGTQPVDGASQYLEFQESISIKGGGQKFGCVEVNNGPGVRQRLRTHAMCTATQSGSAVGYLRTPDLPPPIWPFALVDSLPDTEQKSPTSIGVGRDQSYINQPVSWSYSYQWPFRLFGTPHYLLG